MRAPYQLLNLQSLPDDSEWLRAQAGPVIAFGDGCHDNADVIVTDEAAARPLVATIDRAPHAALMLVQVLRAIEHLPVQDAMTVESLAYALLQGGPEFRAWLAARQEAPHLVSGGEGPPIRMQRRGDVVTAYLNRPGNRNALSVEMRDALVELFELVALDSTIERLELRGAGSCFSVGGELREFGLATDPCEAHAIRSAHNPGRLLAAIADRVHCYLHSACIGSGIELPAFASRLVAERGAFFQLPELRFGLIPGAGGCVSIARRIGRQRTAWLALSGNKIRAATALEWGLVDEVVEKESANGGSGGA